MQLQIKLHDDTKQKKKKISRRH